MTPEEEAQNKALLEAYDPEAPPPPPAPVVMRLGSMGPAVDQARQELAFQPPPATVPAASRPAQATAVEQDTGPTYTKPDAGERITSGLSALGGLVKSFGAMRVAHARHNTAGGAMPAIDRLSQSGENQVAQAAQTQDQEARARKAEERQAWQDKQQMQDRNATRNRQAFEDQFSAEARDANSTKSKNLRSEIKTAFPQFAQDMGPDFDSMSLADFAKSPHPGLDKAKFDAMTERQRELWSQRGTQTLDVTKLKAGEASDLEDKKQAGRIELKKMPSLHGKVGAGGKGGPGGGMDVSEYEAALDKEFGGRDKVPPTLLAQLHAAAKTGKSEQVRMVMQAAHGQNVGGQKQVDMETNTYAKAAEPYEKTLAWAKNARKELKAAGIDPDNYQGQDIPGYGRVKSYVPDAALSAQGQRMRSVIGGQVAGLVLEMSGKASSDKERAQLTKIAGAMKGGAPENVVWGLRQLEGMSKAGLERMKASHTRGSAASQEHKGEIRVKDSKGTPGWYAGTAEEAQAEGLTVIQ